MRRNFMDFEYMKMLAVKDAVRDAVKEAEKKTREEVYISLVQKGVLSLADAVKLSGFSENQLREHVKQ